MPSVNGKVLRPILLAQIDAKSCQVTDDANTYKTSGHQVAKHFVVNHLE